MINCHAIICGAGFETPAEALYLGKKMMVMPIKGQYEQRCNAVALERLGIKCFYQLNDTFGKTFEDWNQQPQRGCVAIRILHRRNYFAPNAKKPIITRRRLELSFWNQRLDRAGSP